MCRAILPPAVPLLVLSGLYLISLGCGGLPASNLQLSAQSIGPVGAISVSISPQNAVLSAGSSLQFTVTSRGPSTTDLEWRVNGVPGGNSASGTISQSGLYTAPQSVNSNVVLVVAVTSKTGPNEAGSATVSVMPELAPIAVSLTPGVARLYTSHAQQFTAIVEGTTNQGISWAVDGNEGGNSSVGTISSTGIYTAPVSEPDAPSVTVTATSSYDTGSSAAAAVTIVADPAPVTAPATTWKPTVLGVPWASDFVTIAANQINVKTDARLTVKAKGDGITDDTAAIRAAIQLASSTGGGMVYFPASNYKIVTPSAPSGAVKGSPLVVPSRVILRGDSSATSRIFVNDPQAGSETDWTGTWGGIDFQGASLSGMTDLGVYASNSSSPCALLWNRGSSGMSELFFNNLSVGLGNCRPFWLEATNDLLIQDSAIDSTNSLNSGNASQCGPVYVAGNTNVSFLKNAVTYHFGRLHMENNTNLLMQGNTVIRDALNKNMDDGTAVESGGVELSFSQNIQVLDNTIKTLNASSDETGDGEAIMSQQSTVPDVLDAGSANAITSTTLTDTSALWGPVTESRLAQYPGAVVILTGNGTGEWRTIEGVNTSTKTVTLNKPWNPVPGVGSLYSIFSWTLMNATIQGNTLIDNPNGILLYDGCYGCNVQNNTLTNSRGILLRVVDELLNSPLYPEGRRVHEVAINDSILNNTVSNTSGVRPAYIALDTEAFDPNSYSGMGMIDVQVGGNVVKPYSPSPSLTYKPGPTEITQEGLFPCFLFGPAVVKAPVTTVFQNINFWNNSQSASVTYDTYFLQFTTNACVTPSPSPAGNAP
jgi:parallel beta-helix repeat protein